MTSESLPGIKPESVPTFIGISSGLAQSEAHKQLPVLSASQRVDEPLEQARLAGDII
jgi:hypothetical protein